MTKKLFPLYLCLLLFVNQGIGQSDFTPKHNISIGYGFGNLTNTLLKNYVDYQSFEYNSNGPFFGKYEYRINRLIGLGVNISYLSGEATFVTKDSSGSTIKSYTNTISRKGINIMGRANIHFSDEGKWDPYFGISFGYRLNQWKINFTDKRLGELKLNASKFVNFFPIGIEATLGTRYMFSQNIGIYGEIGLSRAFLQVGLTGSF